MKETALFLLGTAQLMSLEKKKPLPYKNAIDLQEKLRSMICADMYYVSISVYIYIYNLYIYLYRHNAEISVLPTRCYGEIVFILLYFRVKLQDDVSGDRLATLRMMTLKIVPSMATKPSASLPGWAAGVDLLFLFLSFVRGTTCFSFCLFMSSASLSKSS